MNPKYEVGDEVFITDRSLITWVQKLYLHGTIVYVNDLICDGQEQSYLLQDYKDDRFKEVLCMESNTFKTREEVINRGEQIIDEMCAEKAKEHSDYVKQLSKILHDSVMSNENE